MPEITTEGVVLVTGSGDVGQLGLGPDILEKTRPALVNLNKEVVDVCAGGMHTVCLTKDGKVHPQAKRLTSSPLIHSVLGINVRL